MPYNSGVGPYRGICNEVVSRGMLGFRLTGPNVAEQCNDGEVVRCSRTCGLCWACWRK
jgi:hypothetical protein